MYLLFRGVRHPEDLLSVLLGLTDLDVLFAPGLMAVHLEAESDAQVIENDPDIMMMDDDPEGFWCSEVIDEDGFLDAVEHAFRHPSGRRGMRPRR